MTCVRPFNVSYLLPEKALNLNLLTIGIFVGLAEILIIKQQLNYLI